MRGSLCLKGGVLYVGHAAMTAHVRAFDLDGRALEAGFSFRAPNGGRASVDGLAIDEDHRVWIADSASMSLRCFTLFGAEIAHAAAESDGRGDRRGSLGVPADVITLGSDDEQRLVVASQGVRRHGVQVLPLAPQGGRTLSLRPEGDPNGRFRGVCRIASLGRLLYVCESGARRIQVFRDGEFHFAFEICGLRGWSVPSAIAPLPGGRAVVALAGERSGLVLVDSSGRPLGVLAESGSEEGAVDEPTDLALDGEGLDASSRLAVIDLGGDRIQVFNLEGGCYGSFPRLSLSSPPAARDRASRIVD